MTRYIGENVTKVIRTMSLVELTKEKYAQFVKTIVKLGERTARYVKNTLYNNQEPCNNIDPNLSIRHIAGLADYITEDMILDIKVRNNIDEKCVRQVLAYHYLSTKRSDLHIKRVIVYDATSDRAVTIDIVDGSPKDKVLSITGAQFMFFDLFNKAETGFMPINIEELADEALETLNQTYRDIAYEFYWERLKEEEIAQEHNYSLEYIKRTIDECRVMLKLKFWEFYLNRMNEDAW